MTPIKLKIKYTGQAKAVEMDVLSISLDGYGLNYQEIGSPRFNIIEYDLLDWWKAEGKIGDSHKEHSKKLLEKTTESKDPLLKQF